MKCSYELPNDSKVPSEHCSSEREGGLHLWRSEWRSCQHCAGEKVKANSGRNSLAEVEEKEAIVFQD